MNKKNAIPFLVGLLCGLLILGVVFFSTDKVQSVNAHTTDVKDPYSPIKVGWSETVEGGKLDFSAIRKFMELEQIKLVTFVNENGGFLLSNANGEEFDLKGWRQMTGTKVGSEGIPIRDGSRLTTFNQMTIFKTQGSPSQIFIPIDGFIICIDFSQSDWLCK